MHQNKIKLSSTYVATPVKSMTFSAQYKGAIMAMIHQGICPLTVFSQVPVLGNRCWAPHSVIQPQEMGHHWEMNQAKLLSKKPGVKQLPTFMEPAKTNSLNSPSVHTQAWGGSSNRQTYVNGANAV